MGTPSGMTVAVGTSCAGLFLCSENMMDDQEKGRTPLGADGARAGRPPLPAQAEAKDRRPCSRPLPPAAGSEGKSDRPCSSPPLRGHSVDPAGSTEPLGPLRPAHAAHESPSPVNGRGLEAPPPPARRAPPPPKHGGGNVCH